MEPLQYYGLLSKHNSLWWVDDYCKYLPLKKLSRLWWDDWNFSILNHKFLVQKPHNEKDLVKSVAFRKWELQHAKSEFNRILMVNIGHPVKKTSISLYSETQIKELTTLHFICILQFDTLPPSQSVAFVREWIWLIFEVRLN